MTFCRIHAALEEIGLLDKYLGDFKGNSIDDELMDSCSEDVDLTSTLKGVMPIAGHRLKFLKAFRALPVSTLNTAFHRIEAALEEIGVRDKYIKNFEENSFDDETIDSCMDDPDFASNLKDIIPAAGHRTKFLKAFRALPVPALNSTQGRPPGRPSISCSPRVASSQSKEQGDQAQPVQIMVFKDSRPGEPSEIIFHEDRLEKILNKTKSKKVAVLAIAGPCRKGKSFFLNFVLKYLNSLKTGDKDWMGWNKPQNRLEGFEWKNSTERVTTGIWLWPEPFIMKSNDEDFDLLVMDTQGVFDDHTTQREWSILVGLGLLTSSCLIFNTMTDLQEDYLQVFENFLSFGLMAINDQDTRTPFQKLVFLIRDWNVPEQYPYGSGGGGSFIKNKLAPKSHHKQAHRRVREQLKECFEEISCFLLPHPGEKVLALDFDGAATDSKTFAEEIQNCILKLMNPSSFPLKKVNGNFLTGQDLLATFRSYCDLFNTDEVPSPESVLDIAAKGCNDVIIRKCMDTFLPDLNAQLITRPFFPPGDLEELITSFSRSCLEAFDKGRKMGSLEMKREARKKLQQQIDVTIEGLVHANDEKLKQVVSHSIDISAQVFEEVLEESLQKGFVPANKVDQIYAHAKEKACQAFTSSCGIRGRKELPKDYDKMCSNLEARMSGFRDKNALAKNRAQQALDQSVRTLVSSYLENVTSQVQDRIVLAQDLLRIQELAKNKAVFELQEQNIQEELLQDGIDSLKITIYKEFQRIKATVENSNQNIRLQGDSLVNQVVEEYKKKLKSELTLNREKFHGLHEDVLNESKAFVRSSLKIQDEEFQHKVQTEVEDRIKKAFPELLELVDQEECKLRSLLGEKKENAAQEYTSSIHNQFPQDDQSPVECLRLQGAHDKEKSQALESFKELAQNAIKAFPGADAGLLDGFLVKLEESIEHAFKSVEDSNRLKMHRVVSEVKVLLLEAKQAYREELKPTLVNVAGEDELRKIHLRVRVKSIDNFKLKIRAVVSSPELLEKWLEELTGSIDDEFKGFLELFKKMKEAEDVLRAALIAARKYYNNEMEKYFQAKDWLKDSELEGLHQKIGTAAVKMAQKEGELSPKHEEKLREVMMHAYRKYKEMRNVLRMPQDSYPIGIDFGTTYSRVAVCVKGVVRVIEFDQKTTFPSYVAFNPDHSISVGQEAKDGALRLPDSTIFEVRRLIGRKFSDQIVKDNMRLWPFQVVGDNDDQPKIQIPGHVAPYRPEQISAILLFRLKTMAEEYLNRRVTCAVVTVPAYFNDSQKQATKDAAEIAGLRAVILSEPISAAIAYQLHKPADLKRNVLIFDLGGDTFDVAVLQTSGVKIDVKAIAGDTHLGGEDFNNEMERHIIEKFKKKSNVDLTRGKDSTDFGERIETEVRLQRIRSACETHKRHLSSAKFTMIDISRIDGNHDLVEKITREEFEKMNMQKFQRCIDITAMAILDAGLDKTDIDDIVLIGGSTRIPMIRQLLKEFFNGKDLDSTMNADEAVAHGAAIHAALEFWEGDKIPRDIQVSGVSVGCSEDVKIETHKGRMSRNDIAAARASTTAIRWQSEF